MALKIISTMMVCVSGGVSMLFVQATEKGSAIDNILGPLGALAFSVTAVAVLVRYLMKREAIYQEEIKDRIKSLEEEVAFWRDAAVKKGDS